MKKRQRPLTKEEIADKYRFINFFQWRSRRKAREEVQNGIAEILEFSVSRAWLISTCGGSPCCPNSWLFQTTDNEFVWITSDDYLALEEPKLDGGFPNIVTGGHFPGSNVVIERWPITGRVISAIAMGNSIPFEIDIPKEALVCLPSSWNDCFVLQGSELLKAFAAGS